MSWLLKLFETYERCAGREPDGAERLAPIAHTTQQAQIEIAIDGDGNFRRARVLDKRASTTMIPCTEASGGRSGKSPINHPLCDKLQYIAADYLPYGGVVTIGFTTSPDKPHRDYLASLEAWARSDNSHTKVQAILRYVKRGCVMRDLIAAQVLPTAGGKLLKAWNRENGTAPEIFKSLPAGSAPEDAFIRWVVEDSANPASGTWQDAGLATAWIAHYGASKNKVGCCIVQGEQASLATQHPAKVRNSSDKAKLLSSNDTSGYTFRGRFHDADEAVSVGFDVTQKAHIALGWLIRRQSYRHADQVIVSWSVGGEKIPDPFMDSLRLTTALGLPAETGSADTAQAFAVRLKRSLAGYGSKLDPGSDIVVMGLDSTSGMQGRMAISYYRELKGSEFLERIEAWHTKVAWHQNFGKDSHFVGAPAPKDIVEAAFGRRVDDRLLKSSIERLLPCIVDGQAIPHDLVVATSRRASNRTAFKPNERWEWEKCLGIACALFKGYHTERDYQMALEPDRTTRDYLYGCLLAIAENIESSALFAAGEKRDTSSARLMQRFADRPFSTWRTIETSLAPYKSRLRAQRGGLLFKREQLLDDTMAKFKADDYVNDSPLTGEFLLGYHCQRQDLRPPKPNAEGAGAGADSTTPDNDE